MESAVFKSVYVKKGGVKSACILGDNQYAVAGSTLGSIMLLPLDPSLQPQRLTGHTGSVTSVGAIYESSTIVSGSEDSTVRIWRESESTILRPNDGAINSISLAQAKPDVFIVGENGIPSIYDINEGELVIKLPQHTGSVSSGAIDAEGCIVVTGSDDGVCRFFDTRSGKITRQFKTDGAITSVAISEIASYAAAGCADGVISIYDYKANDFIAEEHIHSMGVTSVAFSPTMNLLVSGSHDHEIQLSNATTLKNQITLRAHTDSVECVGWSYEGDKFVSCGADRGVFVWNTPEIEDDEDNDNSYDLEEDIDDFYDTPAPSVQIQCQSTEGTASDEQSSEKSSQRGPTKLEVMNGIFNQIQTLQKSLETMEERQRKVDTMITQIENAQDEMKYISTNY